MKKALGIVILFVLIFTMASPMNVFAKKDTSTSVDYKALTEEEIKKWQTDNVFEIVISKFLLSLGDYARFNNLLLNLANYADESFDFAYDLFEDFEKNKELAYTFVNALRRVNK